MADKSPILRSLYLQWLLVQIFPRLRVWPVDRWPVVLGKAQDAELDQFERIGIIAAVVIATGFLQPATFGDVAVPFVFLSQFVIALPLLFILAGPFFLRRIRRFLDAEACNRDDGKSGSSRERN